MVLHIVEDGVPAGTISFEDGGVDLAYDGDDDRFREFVEGFDGQVMMDTGEGPDGAVAEGHVPMDAATLEGLVLARVNHHPELDGIHVAQAGERER